MASAAAASSAVTSTRAKLLSSELAAEPLPTGTISTVAGNGTLAYSTDTRGALQSGFAYLTGIAVDSTGNLYAIDEGNNRVLKLAAGSASQEVLPFTGLKFPRCVAVDTAGSVYVTDTSNNRVLKLPVQ